MSTQGVGTFLINSKFSSGTLVFYEKAVGRTATGDVLTIGTTAVKVGGTAQDVDFQFYATGSVSAIIDAGASSLTLTGLNVVADGDYVITQSTGTTGLYGFRAVTTFTLATTGVHKSISGEVTYTPATSGYATPIGVAGKVALGSNFTGGVGYMWGVQGNMDFGTSHTINNASSIFAAVRAVVSGTTPTFTEAEGICGLYTDNLCATNMNALATGFSSHVFCNNSGGWMNTAIYLREANKVTNLFRFEDCGTMVTAQAAKTGTAATLTCDWEGTTYYIVMNQA